eukprot:3607631-Prorocentrum_lima.AAC.1
MDFLRMGRWDQAARLLPVLPSLRDRWDSDALPLLAGVLCDEALDLVQRLMTEVALEERDAIDNLPLHTPDVSNRRQRNQ